MICGVIAEFNPFHNGHQALINAARAAGAEYVLCVMSGNFVQRGSAAVTDKRVRAGAALKSGADLILELPLAFSVSTAQRFAKGAVNIIAACGCADMVAFGSECGDIEPLRLLAGAIDEAEVTSSMRRLLERGITFAKARELAVAEIYGSVAAAPLSRPNDVLGIEYLRQMELQQVNAKAFTVKRLGTEHHDNEPRGEFAGASWLRERADDMDLWARYVPCPAARVYSKAKTVGLLPSDPAKLDTAILAHLRRLELADLAALPDISEGLEHRMLAAIRASAGISELMAALKTKRYTMARIRRLILSAFLGLTARDCDADAPYLRVLGFNEKGRTLLSVINRRKRLPLSASLAELARQKGTCERFAKLEDRATNLYGLTLPCPLPCGYEYTSSGIFPKKSQKI